MPNNIVMRGGGIKQMADRIDMKNECIWGKRDKGKGRELHYIHYTG